MFVGVSHRAPWGIGAAVAAVLVGFGTGCAPLGVACGETTLEARPATVVKGKGGEKMVRFEARLIDSHGDPVPGISVSMGADYRYTSEHPAGRARVVAAGTGDDGVAAGEVSFEEIQLTTAGGVVQPTWTATTDGTEGANGILYCPATAKGPLPEEVQNIGT